MSGLSKLYLRGTGITDVGLRNLSDLTNLTELDLADTGITDTGLSYLAGLTKLRRLNLRAANVTDGTGRACGDDRARRAEPVWTKVSNAGLGQGRGAETLRALDLRYSRATNAACASWWPASPIARCCSSIRQPGIETRNGSGVGGSKGDRHPRMAPLHRRKRADA